MQAQLQKVRDRVEPYGAKARSKMESIGTQMQPYRDTARNKLQDFYVKFMADFIARMSRKAESQQTRLELTDAELQHKLNDAKEITAAVVKLSIALLAGIVVLGLGLQLVINGGYLASWTVSQTGNAIGWMLETAVTPLTYVNAQLIFNVALAFCTLSAGYVYTDVLVLAREAKMRGDVTPWRSLLLDRNVPDVTAKVSPEIDTPSVQIENAVVVDQDNAAPQEKRVSFVDDDAVMPAAETAKPERTSPASDEGWEPVDQAGTQPRPAPMG